MATATVQSVLDDMTDEQKDAAYLLFGATASDDSEVGGDTIVSGDKTLEEVYNSFSDLQRFVVDFIAGGIPSAVQHADDEFIENFLEHYGVPGMKWGVRKSAPTTTGARIPLSKSAKNNESMRREARLKVEQNKSTLEEAHIAGLKSTGHRVANGFLGDKTFWKRNLAIAGATAVAAYGSMVAPGMLPAGLLNDLGGLGLGSWGVGVDKGQTVQVDGKEVSSDEIRESAGYLVTSAAALATTAAVGTAAVGVNAVSNVVRAVRGNARVSKSYRKLGDQVLNHSSEGSKKVRKVLKRNGSIKVKHDEEFLDTFLAHFGIPGMKWGVRRRVGSSGRVVRSDPGTDSGKSKAGDDDEAQKSADFDRAAKAFAKAQEKGTQALSNDEIKAITNRINAERSFNQLTSDQKSELQRKVDYLKLEKEYRQLSSELAVAKRSTGKKVVGALVGAAATAVNNHAATIGKSMIDDMLGLNKPSLKDQLQKKNDLMRTQKENKQLSDELKKMGISTATPSSPGTPFRVNPAKVTISR